MAELGHAYVTIDVQIDPWSQLTLRIWAEHLEARAVFDRLEDHWAPWIAELPVDGPFDWMSWRPWEMMRHTLWPLNPIFPFQQNPDPWRLPPDPFFDRSRWTLPDYPDGNSPWFGLPMGNDEFRKLLAYSITDWPAKTWQPEPTHLEVAPYADDAVTLRLWPNEDEEAVAARRAALERYWRGLNIVTEPAFEDAGDALKAGQGPDGTLID